MGEKIILKEVRCSYVFVHESNKKGTWGIQPLVPKDHSQLKKLKALISAEAKNFHGAKVKAGMLKLPLRDGDEERDTEEYKGMYFFNANNAKKRPGIAISRNGAIEIPDADDIEKYCYSGAYFNVSINVYGFPATDGGKPGVAVGLNNIMLLPKKGDQPRLDGSASATDDFADFAEDDDDLGCDDFDDDDFL